MKNEFKEKLKQNMSNQTKGLTDEQIEKSILSEFILLPYEREMTEEEKEEYISLDEKEIPGNMLLIIWNATKYYFETGEKNDKSFFDYMKATPQKTAKKIFLPEVGEKYQLPPEKWQEWEEQHAKGEYEDSGR